jgi:hypothetical protein
VGPKVGALLIGALAVSTMSACPQRGGTIYGGPPPTEQPTEHPVGEPQPSDEGGAEPVEPSEAGDAGEEDTGGW